VRWVGGGGDNCSVWQVGVYRQAPGRRWRAARCTGDPGGALSRNSVLCDACARWVCLIDGNSVARHHHAMERRLAWQAPTMFRTRVDDLHGKKGQVQAAC